jgi:hypothetical protein
MSTVNLVYLDPHRSVEPHSLFGAEADVASRVKRFAVTGSRPGN